MRSRFGGLSRAIRACAVAATLLFIARAGGAARSLPDLPVAGWLERARITPGDVIVEAKLDSGARTSSLDARNLQRFDRGGEHWVAFDVTGEDGRAVRIERPLVRTSRVRSALGTDHARLTVTLGICVGRVYQVAEVSLVDRSGLSKPLLIGRRFLSGRLLVDTSSRHRLEPECGSAPMPS